MTQISRTTTDHPGYLVGGRPAPDLGKCDCGLTLEGLSRNFVITPAVRCRFITGSAAKGLFAKRLTCINC